MRASFLTRSLTASLLLVVASGCNSTKKVSEKSDVKLYMVKEADVKAGGAIFQKGTASGAAACITCHGASGEGQAGGGFPRLANQSRYYTSEQLHAFKEGLRNNPVMMPIAKAMNDQEIEDLSAYLETIATPKYSKVAKMTEQELRRGKQLAEVGDPKAGVQSCANCHGPGGIGEAPAIPYLQGQLAVYTTAQLMAWKNGTRKTSADHMGVIAVTMTEDDIKTMASYFEKLPGSSAQSMAPKNRDSK